MRSLNIGLLRHKKDAEQGTSVAASTRMTFSNLSNGEKESVEESGR